MGPIVAVAVSGGIDSLTAAYLLKTRGLDVVAIHFITGFEADPDLGAKVRTVLLPLGIHVHLLDCRSVFKSTVVDYFTAAYLAGQTPNPCVVCNAQIKFGTVLEFARGLGASHLATGHYARIGTGPGFYLLKGADPAKDQSYFLARLTPAQLAMACFPLGQMTKDQVKALAVAAGLKPVRQDESQDVCFINAASTSEFLAQTAGGSGPGPIVTTEGRTIGTHPGLYRFTIGQRRGINCPDARPYYVVGMDRDANRLIVGRPADLLRSTCRVNRINWIGPVPQVPFKAQTRLRYRSPAASGMVHPAGPCRAELCFDRPQAAVTPGQAAVFYEGDRVIGGGWIDG